MKLDFLRSQLQPNNRLYGLFCCSYSIQATEAIAHSGYDFLIFDTEHTPNSFINLHTQLLALGGTDTASIIRIKRLDLSEIKLCLDLGVHGIMIPNIDTVEQAKTAIDFMTYTPNGQRGVGGSVRGSRYGRDKPDPSKPQQQRALIVQAESVEALNNIEKIAALEGVDAVFFGPNDLAADMGYFGQPNHPEVVASIISSIQKLKKIGKVTGVLAGEKDCGQYLEAGASVVALGSELGLMVAGADSLQQRIRQRFESL